MQMMILNYLHQSIRKKMNKIGFKEIEDILEDKLDK